MAIDVKWFQDRIRDLGTSQRQISQKLGNSPNLLSLVLTGKRRVPHEELAPLAALLDTTTDEILKRLGTEAPASTRAHTIRCIGTVDETGRVTPATSPREVSAPANATVNTKCIVFRSIRDAGDFQHGYTYYFEEPVKPRAVDADSLNSLCVVEVGDSPGYHLGIVRRSLERGRFDLMNAVTGDLIVGNVAVRSASPVTWIKTT